MTKPYEPEHGISGQPYSAPAGEAQPWLFEEDEPAEQVKAAFDRGEHGFTRHPDSDVPVWDPTYEGPVQPRSDPPADPPFATYFGGFQSARPTEARAGYDGPNNVGWPNTLPPPMSDPIDDIVGGFEEMRKGHDGNEHLDGVPWWDASAPPRNHEHWAQTTGMISESERVERCACGAIRSNLSHGWTLLDPPRVGPDGGDGGGGNRRTLVAALLVAAVLVVVAAYCVTRAAVGGPLFGGPL